MRGDLRRVLLALWIEARLLSQTTMVEFMGIHLFIILGLIGAWLGLAWEEADHDHW